MSDVVWIALVGVIGVLGTGLLSPLVLNYLNARAVAAKEERDYDRQDEVAARVAAVAKTAADAAALAAADTRKLMGKIDVVHTLVNSQMTVAMQAELDATARELALMIEVAELRHAANPGMATPAVDRAIALTKERLAVLQDALNARHEAAVTVLAQQKAQAQPDAVRVAGRGETPDMPVFVADVHNEAKP